jgi:carboxypeptidase family protein/TonB-dependent receptor-like protein
MFRHALCRSCWQNRRSVGRSALLGALIFVLPSTIAHAQSLDAVVMGRLTDESGAAIPGASVVATQEATGVARTAVSGAAGLYLLLNLPAGTYIVRAELDGFAPSTRKAQTLYVGTTVTIDFQLKLAGLVEHVTVGGTLPLLETSKSTLTRIVQTAEIDTLPLINRNFNDLAALAPGVTKTGVYGGVDISGSRDFQNALQVDGISAERQQLGDQRIPYAQDWIQEFQVLTSQSNAEFGGASGGVLNVITRSGGNQVRGRLYGFFRNDAWDATPALVTRKSPLREHRVGATVGGAIVTDRVFYFGGVERFDNASSNVVNSSFTSANGTFPSTDQQALALAKLDVVVSARQQVRLRNNGQRERTTGSSVGGISTQEHGRFSEVRANDTVSNWTWVVSPTTLNEVRAAWSTSVPQGGCNFAAAHPIGTWFERSYPGAQFGCPVNVGTIAEDQFQLVHNVSWTHGRHTVKLGTHTSWIRSFGDFRNFRDGRYSFERDRPFSLSDPDSYPFSLVVIQGPTDWNVSSWSSGLFGQDQWRVTDNLTLNVGIRYDVDGSLTALNALVRVDTGLHTINKDLNNVAPRLGVSWTPFHHDKRTVLRGGAGLFYDQNHNNVATIVLLNNILVDRIVSVNANSPLLNPFWPDIAGAKRLLAEALARNEIPDLSAFGSVAGSTNDVDQNLQIPATRQFSGGIEHEFGRWVHASADFVDAHGFDLYVIRNVNLDPSSFQRLNPNYSSINAFGNGGWNDYNALQVQVNVIPSADRLVKIAYTLAKNRSNTKTTLSAGAATNPFDFAEDEGPADNDVHHTLAINGSTDLPLGTQLSGILTYRSALPYSATTNAPRPDGKPFAFRPEPRNARRGDGALSLDLRLAKTMKVGARLAASAFLELFNVTNQLNYGDYIGTVTSALFGQPTTAGPKRRVQLGLRVDF